MQPITHFMLSMLFLFFFLSGCGHGLHPDMPESVFQTKQQNIRHPRKDLHDGESVKVTHIIDGDSLHVLNERGRKVKLRILGFNAPECSKTEGRFPRCKKDQEYFGYQSYIVLRSFFEKSDKNEITVDCKEKKGRCQYDAFGRYLVYLENSEHQDLGTYMIANGAAWSYTKYPSKKRKEYCFAEAESICNASGMWKKGTSLVTSRMNKATRRWYLRGKQNNHEQRCSKALGIPFKNICRDKTFLNE